MGLGSVAKKAKSTVSKAKDVAKKASPQELKKSALDQIKAKLQDPASLGKDLMGMVDNLFGAGGHQKAMDAIRSIQR